MSRLQKKCLIATTGFHLLLVLTLVFGSTLFVAHSKTDDTHVLTVIPDKLIDEAFSSGVKSAQPPAPNPDPPQPPQPIQQTQPAPPQPPQPQVPDLPKHVEPPPEPEKSQKLSPDDLKTVDQPEKTAKSPHKITVNKDVVTRSTQKTPETSARDKAREQQRLNAQRNQALLTAIRNIDSKSSKGTVVDMPGASSAAYANYMDAVASLFYDAWTPPENVANDDAIAKVRILIGRDGTIISARIIGPSGDPSVDASVRGALDRVSSVPPFPEGAKDSQRSLILNFNLKTKRMYG
jgi:TonB family protein